MRTLFLRKINGAKENRIAKIKNAKHSLPGLQNKTMVSIDTMGWDANEKYKNVFRNCMANHGHKVLN